MFELRWYNRRVIVDGFPQGTERVLQYKTEIPVRVGGVWHDNVSNEEYIIHSNKWIDVPIVTEYSLIRATEEAAK